MAAARGRGSAGSSRAPVVAGAATFLCAAVLLLAAAPAAEAGTTHLVGDAAGWTHSIDYGKWAAARTFQAGDILVFKYNSTYHDVAWVSKGGYKKCIVSPKGRAPVYHTGYDAVKLPRGTHYFICSMPNHCSKGGMKLAVTVY